MRPVALAGALALLSTTTARADQAPPSPPTAQEPPRLALVPPPFDVAALEAQGKRKFFAGMGLSGAGALVGAASLALFLVPVFRTCPASDPGCNSSIDTAGNLIGGIGTAILAVGITLFSVGLTERRIARRLRDTLFCAPALSHDQR